MRAAETSPKYRELAEFSELRFDRVEDERGSRYVYEVAVWEDGNSKRADSTRIDKEGKDRVEISSGIFADGAARFNICYDLAGIRIVEYDVRGVIHWRRIDTGELVPREKAITLERQPEWEREKFTRDLQDEARECYERWRLRRLEDNLLAVKPDQRGTTYAGQVAAGNADATALVGNPATTDASFDYTGTVAYLAGGGLYEGRSTGALFSGVTIPVGSTINSAVGQVYFCDAGATSMTSRPCFHAHDDSPNFATTQSIHPRTRTTLGTQWGSAGMGTGWKSTGNVASSLQEVINLAGWNSGQSITMIHLYGTTNNGIAYVSTYERNTSQAAKLDIDYSAAATGGRKNPLGYPLRGPFGGPLG